MDIQAMMQKAQEMQQKLAELQAKLEDEETEGSSGGGMVKIYMNGKGYAKSLKIDPSLANSEDINMLEDLVVAAINDAKSKVETKFSDAMQSMSSEMGLPPGIKLPF